MLSFQVKNVQYTDGKTRLKIVGSCKSTDDKPLTFANGSELREIDTGKLFVYNEAAKEWSEKAEGGGGGGGSNLLADANVTFVSAASEIQIPITKDASAFVVIITPSDDVVIGVQDSSVIAFYLTYGVALYPAVTIAGLGITNPGMVYRFRGSTSTGGITTLTGILLENGVVTVTSSNSLRFYTGGYNFKIYELA